MAVVTWVLWLERSELVRVFESRTREECEAALADVRAGRTPWPVSGRYFVTASPETVTRWR